MGDGACRTTASQQTAVLPGEVALDPTKRYYISILPGDAANPFSAGYTGAPCAAATATAGSTCIGHGMGGAPIAAGQTSVKVISEPSPYQPGKLSVFVFEDDFPLNGENDSGGGVDVLAPNEPGLGGFNIELWDMMAGYGDFTGQMTYDMFNQPLSNSLAGTIDPVTGFDACPISKQDSNAKQAGITGMIVTCPKYESDGKALSPLAGQAIIANLMPGLFGVIATPGADRIAKGEEWLQTNTLDGQKAHDSFVRIGEPSYFQEYGPANYHVTIGFANPAIINGRHAGVCGGTDINLQAKNCTNTLIGKITTERMSRTPDERLYSSGSHDSFYWTQCYVSVGDPDGEDFAFTKCNPDGTFTLNGLPDGTWRVTVFDQWNDMLVDGLSTPVSLGSTVTARNDEQRPAVRARLVRIRLRHRRHRDQPMAVEHLHPHVHRRQQERRIDQRGRRHSAHSGVGALPGRQPRQHLEHRLHRHRELQRDVPAVQLVRRGIRHDALQEHRHARGLRCGWSRGRHAGLFAARQRLPALRQLRSSASTWPTPRKSIPCRSTCGYPEPCIALEPIAPRSRS